MSCSLKCLACKPSWIVTILHSDLLFYSPFSLIIVMNTGRIWKWERIQWRDKSDCWQLRVSTVSARHATGWRVVILTTWHLSVRHLAPVPHMVMVNNVTWHDDTRSCIHSTYHYPALNTQTICHDIAIITPMMENPNVGSHWVRNLIQSLRDRLHLVIRTMSFQYS